MAVSGFLIHDAEILLFDGEFLRGDVWIERGRIKEVGTAIALPPGLDIPEIPATGLTLLPGVIDSQVHFGGPGPEYKIEEYREYPPDAAWAG